MLLIDITVHARPAIYLLSGVNWMYANHVLLSANTPPCVNTVCIVYVWVRMCVAFPPPGLFSTYWLKDFSCVFLTAESLLKTTGLRNRSVALRSRSARSSSALFCQRQRKCAFMPQEFKYAANRKLRTVFLISELDYKLCHE